MKYKVRITSLFLVFVLSITYLTPVLVFAKTNLVASNQFTSVETTNFSAVKKEKDISSKKFASDYILVEMKDDVSAKKLVGKYGLTSQDVKSKKHLVNVEIPEGYTAEQFAKELEKNPNVEAAAPNYFRKVLEYDTTPNDPGYTDPTKGWWLRENGLNISTIWNSLNQKEYGPRATGQDVVVAVLDSGYILSHPDKGPNIIPMKDEFESYSESTGIFVTDTDVTPTDLSVAGNTTTNVNHGTAVAGQISAASNNGLGVIGVSYDAKVLFYKVAGKYYRTGSSTPEFAILDEALVNGIKDAVADGADIINISIGGPTASRILQNAINEAHEAGVMVVAATGNDGRNNYVYYPAACENVIGVGSYEYDSLAAKKIRAPHANYGVGGDPTIMGYYGFTNGQIDILAPGTKIYGLYGSSGYASWTGTSMASPAFAGTAALLWRFAPHMTADEISNVILQTANADGVGQPNLTHGWGYVNPLAAYNRLKNINPALSPTAVVNTKNITNTTSVPVSWNSIQGENVVYDVYLNGATNPVYNNITETTKNITLIPNATNTIEIIPSSKANWYQKTVFNIVSDTVAPTISALNYQNKSVVWSHNETSNFKQQYSLNGGVWQEITGNVFSLTPLEYGNYTFALRVTDAAQNVSSRSVNFTYDIASPPTLTANYPTVYLNDVTVGVQRNSGISSFDYRINGGPISNIVSNVAIGSYHNLRFTNLVNGSNTVEVRAKTSGGSVSDWSSININYINNNTVATINTPAFLYSSAGTLSGTVKTRTGQPVAGQNVTLYRRLTTSSTKYVLATVKTDANGYWKYYYNPVSTWERKQNIVAYYGGKVDSYSPTEIASDLNISVYLSTPKKSTSSPRAKTTFTITGYAKPKFKSGTYPVTALFYKRNTNGTYTLVKSRSMKASYYSTYTKLTGSTYMPSRGSYRVCFRYVNAPSYYKYTYGTTYSSYHYFTVR